MRRAFTLIELLVVVSVIALLIGILLPALSSARAAGRAVACVANLRSMELSQALYANEHDGALVDVGLSHGGVYTNEQGSWLNTLAPYYEGPVVRRCAADQSAHWPVEEGGGGESVPGSEASATPRYRRTSYCVNDYLTSLAPDKAYDAMHKIARPAETVQFLELVERGDFAGSDHPHVESWAIPGLPDSTPRLAAEQLETDQHGGVFGGWEARCNYGFLDGHAGTHQFRDVYTSIDRNDFDPGTQ